MFVIEGSTLHKVNTSVHFHSYGQQVSNTLRQKETFSVSRGLCLHTGTGFLACSDMISIKEHLLTHSQCNSCRQQCRACINKLSRQPGNFSNFNLNFQMLTSTAVSSSSESCKPRAAFWSFFLSLAKACSVSSNLKPFPENPLLFLISFPSWKQNPHI